MNLYYLTKDGVDAYRSNVIEPLQAGEAVIDWNAISKTSDASINHADVFQVIKP